MSSNALPPVLESAWKAAGMRLLVMAVLLAFGFADTWQGLFKVWMQSETYGHGAIVAPISAWLLWRDRERWLSQAPQVSWLGLPLIVAGSIGWLVAELASVNVVAQYSLLLLIYGLAWMALGWNVIRTMSFALGFLFFMVPAGDSLNAPLMEATATATIAALRAVGLPVYREGMLFTLPTGQWSVVEACSGLRYVLAAAMLGALFAWMNFRSWRLRITFFVAAMLLALVGNWARAWLVVMIGHLSEMRYGTGDDHVWYGWVFFGLVMGGLFWMGGRIQEHAPESPQDPVVTPGSPGAGTLAGAASPTQAVFSRSTTSFSGILTMFIGLVVVSGAIVYAHEVKKVTPRSTVTGFERLASAASETNINRAPYAWQGARSQIDRQIEFPEIGDRASLIIHGAYFADQDSGYEMISPENQARARRPAGWSSISVRSVSPKPESDRSLLFATRVQEHLLAQGTERRLMWVWYEVDGHRIDSDLMAKAWTAWSMLTGRGDHTCVWVVLTDLEGSLTTAPPQSAETLARERLSRMFFKTSCE